MTSIIKLDANEHPIKSVTVFKSNKAEVVRIFNVSLEEGQSKIQVRHLPGSIDTESARVTGLGDVQLFDVVCSIGPDVEEVDTVSTSETVRKLNARKDMLGRNLDAIDDISETMVNYSKTLAGDTVPPRQVERFFEGFLERSRVMSSARADLEEEILQLSRQIDALSSFETKRQGKTNGEVTVVIMAKQATNIELRLTYLVRNATWSAAYELHATTEAGVPASSVSLHYRARITQSTGEDWTNVGLTLSTADMNLSNQIIPSLCSTKIRPPRSLFGGGYSAHHPQQFAFDQTQLVQQQAAVFGASASAAAPMVFTTPGQSLPPPPPPAPPMPVRRRGRTSDAYAGPPADDWQDVEEDGEDVAEEVSTLTAFGEPTSVVHESPLALTYHVEGASGVPSDGIPHQVSVAVLPFEAKILHVTVPKVRPVAYLEATVKNTSDYRLLPGTVHAFVDDSFVSKTFIFCDVAPDDVFSCTLGADPATRIRYSRTSKRADDGAAREHSAFSEQWATTTYLSRTTVTNRHPFALRALVLRDGVPVSEDEKRVSVVLRRPAGLAELEQGKELKVGAKGDGDEDEDEKRTVRWCKVVDGKGGKKEGLFEWVFEVGAGEVVRIETEWEVKAPVSLRWIESA